MPVPLTAPALSVMTMYTCSGVVVPFFEVSHLGGAEAAGEKPLLSV